LVREFRESLEAARPEAETVAKELYAVLFSQLTQFEASHPAWLISPAPELLQLPFAALLSPNAADKVAHYLAELHSVTILTGAMSVRSPAAIPANVRFLAVGDPIYNVADPRWKKAQTWFGGTTYAEGAQLNRLPGSGREVELIAHAWQNSTLLEGASAVKGEFLKQVGKSGSSPGVIHLATHVLSASGVAKEAFIALGLNADGQPELLGASEIALLRVPQSLVVMSGCHTAGGDVRAGGGMENLTRAWALAGATAIVATQWPVRDSGGEFLAQFYQHLREFGPAEALRKAQAEAIHSGTAASAPALWASYQVYGGAQ
jgi:CHAT domain-containing protein